MDKKYIGLTIYLIGIILLSYFFFYLSSRDKKVTYIVEPVYTGTVNTGNINTGDIEEKEDDNIILTENDIENLKNENMCDCDDCKKDDNLIIGDIVLIKYDSSTYDEIFSLLGLEDFQKYKIKSKEIYIKKLDSIDYETEKNNIRKLIQKIGGDIAEVNWFGDKQFFANLEPYYKKTSVSFVEYNGDLYVMVLSYDDYYKYENTIKEFLFN